MDRKRKRLCEKNGWQNLTSVDKGGLRRYQVEDGKWGLCGPDGEIVTPAVYDKIHHFNTDFGFWVVRLKGEVKRLYKEQLNLEVADFGERTACDWVLSL